MPFPISTLQQLWPSFIPGSRLIDGSDCANLANHVTSNQAGVIALAGGGAAGAPIMSRWVNEVGTCATNNDSVVLPQALPGTQKTIINDGAATLAVFAATTNPITGVADVIVASGTAGGAGAASVTQATSVTNTYRCFKAGFWKQS